jgi:uncharacterized protein (TIGR02001 family)
LEKGKFSMVLSKKNGSLLGLGCLLGAVILGATIPAIASENSIIPGTFSANVALTSEYRFRGLSQTDDAPAIQGGFDYEIEVVKPAALYLGAWASNVDFNEGAGVDGATIEIDLYGGIKGSHGDSGLIPTSIE